ncbi:MAG: double-strand break repair helicase AddA, partial [Rhodobacteraceae bacterium]|nr:double-strand break repair helicase AddA [Paracoccaceae bacterium]
WALFDLPPGFGAADIVSSVFLGIDAAWWGAVVARLQAGGANDKKMGDRMAQVQLAAPGLADLALLEPAFLYASGERAMMAATDARPTKGMRTALGADLGPLQDVMERVAAARPLRAALMSAERAHVLHRFAGLFLDLYQRAKDARGWLDFDDLITKASALLHDSSVAAWVLFRLDGGIDHILVDEAQDTSPAQWRVIESLAAEFTTGASARDENRTLFVVGDKKQSIYSFQGADVSAFDAKRVAFDERFRAAQRPFQAEDLTFSFRSSPAVLGVVDQTFGDRHGRAMGETVQHRAHKVQMPGRVDLWPLIEKSDAADKGDWQDPVDLVADSHHAVRLAEKIADFIKTQLDQGTQIPTDHGPRPVHAGDFLVLVQRRSALFAEVIRACKAAELPIAGADRLKLGAELAVKDLAALLAFLATPEDDLSLAAVLRSPLCGWSEDDLFRLAQPRQGFLWSALVQAADRHPKTHAMLKDLRDQADYLRPFDLIERVLTRHDGRRRLLARLGPEAEDGIDELLSQAIAYESVEVPSLTGFLVWMQTDEVVVKRQMDSEGRRIRVMTVHGAKGLEAPIVILPDTADSNHPDRDEVYALNGRGIWKTPQDMQPPQLSQLRDQRKERTDDENLRLLYVAMTRAQSWLVICGAGDAKKEGNWYLMAQSALARMTTTELPDGVIRHELGDWPSPAPAPRP